MTANELPALSLVILTPHRFHGLRTTIRHLAAQSIRDQIEIVIVAPSARDLQADEQELAVFHNWRVVEVGPIHSITLARAAGIRQAAAPVVALGEDHSYPQPGWAEALLRAHQQPWAVVGPAMCNANPSSAASWANFLIEYGQWMCPAPAGERDHLPGHNSAYKREVFIGYGADLPQMLEAESVIHWDLRARGYRLYLEPAAQTNHLNPSRLFKWLPNRFRGGWSFARSRARGWPWWRKLLYTAGALLLPLRGTWHILRFVRQAGRTRELLPRVLPALLVNLAADGAGRAVGYVLGFGGWGVGFGSLEFGRQQYLDHHDLQAEAARQSAGAQ